MELLQFLELPLALLPASLLVSSLDLVVHDVGVVVRTLSCDRVGSLRPAPIRRVSRQSLLLLLLLQYVIILIRFIVLVVCLTVDLFKPFSHLELVTLMIIALFVLLVLLLP